MDDLMKKNCSVVVPVYNSAKTLPQLIKRLRLALDQIASKYEVILINDCSQDNSWEVITKLIKEYSCVVGINLRRNYGQHNAILCGIRSAKYDYTITMDDDLQHPPEEIHKLLGGLDKGVDVIYGIPNKLPHSNWRNFFSKYTKLLLARVIGIARVRNISSFRAFHTSLRDSFSNFNSPDVIIDALLSWGAMRFETVVVNESSRVEGKSNYNFFKLVKMGMLILTGFSTAPLRFASLVGFSFTVFGVIILIYVLFRYFSEGSIPGFPFLASAITIFSGTQLFALGIFGEYLGHIFERSTARPPYVIDEIKITKNGI
jgi:glycosyltransferase involved in cell wall biosynthesis